MDNEKVEDDVVAIDRIDATGIADVVPIEDSRSGTYDQTPKIPDDSGLRTGNIIGQVFNLIAQVRDRDYWRLNPNEITSLNKTCPKILPKIIAEHHGIISCVLAIVGIIVKRIKLERDEVESERPVIPPGESINSQKFFDNLSDEEKEVIERERNSSPLTGVRTE